MVHVLGCYGADVNIPNNLHLQPLHVACNYGHVAVVRELLTLGADVNAMVCPEEFPIEGLLYHEW